MKIKLPKTAKELRLYHLEAIADIDLEDMQIYDKAVLAHKLTNIDLETIKRISIQDINEIIDHYTNLIGNTKREEPPKSIEVNGRKYKRINSVGKMPMSWHIDIQNFGTKDPAIVASFIYIEEELEYCSKDKHGNILNPVSIRSEIFREHLPAETFISVGFFLSEKSERYSEALDEITRQRRILSKRKEERDKKNEERKKRKKSLSNGKQLSSS